MKITRGQIKKLINKVILSETQVALGIPHGVDLKNNPEVLYSAAMSFLGNNPNLGPNSPRRADAELLIKILDNTIQGTVQHRQMGQGDSDLLHAGDVEGFIASRGGTTTPEQTARMREEQGKLKLARRALGDALGGIHRQDARYKGYQSSRRDFFRANPNYTPSDNDDFDY